MTTASRKDLAGLQLALDRWNEGGPSAHYAQLLHELIAQAEADPLPDPAVSAKGTETYVPTMTEPSTMHVGDLELRRTEDAWEYLSEGPGYEPDRWRDASDVLGPFGGSGVNDLLDELLHAKAECSGDAAVAAIQFAMNDDEGMLFLRYWNEGGFDVIRREWPDAPENVFMGADPLYKTA